MTKVRQFALCLLLVLTGARIPAALSPAEQKAYDSAAEAYRIGFWDRAEAEFADFVAKYPQSEKLAEAVLREAQAQYQQRKFSAAVALLTAHQAGAGKQADEYLYWIGESQYQSTNYPAAVAAFGKVAREHQSSRFRLESAVGEAAAQAKLTDWATVTNLLRQADGAFRQSAIGLTNSEAVTRGYLLLAEAQLALKNYPDAEAAINKIGPGLSGELEWRRRYLLCQALLGAGQAVEARKVSDGLLTVAEELHRPDLFAESVAFQAEILEQLGQLNEAIALLGRNLVTNAPVARQEQALAKITTLALQQKEYGVALKTLQSYLTEFPHSRAVPVALLTLGEVHLKQHAAVLATNDNAAVLASATNHLPAALHCFDQLITTYSNSTLIGRAQLGRGWGYWMEGKYPESATAFGAAVAALPASESLVVARFKLADALFQERKFSPALTNYQAVLQTASNWPAANAELRLPALYQSLRASLALTNFAAAESVVRDILRADPEDPTVARSLLLVAQARVDADQPAEARPWFEEFVRLFPHSEWRPQVELLLARVQEQQGNWTNAVTAYENWLTQFPTNQFRVRTEFQLALALARSGAETNALTHFTNFVARYQTNDLAARAQWWVADYYFRLGDPHYSDAERNYKMLFTTWPDSDLAYEAKMMAGRAAMAWSRYDNAEGYFSSLIRDTNCPPELWSRAVSAYGGALQRQSATETNRIAKYTEALDAFRLIPQRHPADAAAALAWGEIGDCYLQMASLDPRYYDSASNAFQTAISLPVASVATRSQAQCGLGRILENLAAQPNAPDARALLLKARDQYLDVALEKNLRAGETADEFWVKKAALDALRLLEQMQDWPTQDRQATVMFCRRMQKVLPVLGPRFESLINRAQSPPPAGKSPSGV